MKHLSHSDLLEPLQSAFRANHSTETALTKVVNDMFLAVDSDSTTVLVLLELSSAFETVDHGILLDRLRNHFDISGQVLMWLGSYLLGRFQCLFSNNVSGSGQGRGIGIEPNCCP